jgi:hypothetical protein
MPSNSVSPAALRAAQAKLDAKGAQASAGGIKVESLADDRLVGAEAIGRFIDPRLSPRETRRLLETGLYPAWREGRVYVASKTAIREHWEKMTRRFRPPEPKGDQRAQQAGAGASA